MVDEDDSKAVMEVGGYLVYLVPGFRLASLSPPLSLLATRRGTHIRKTSASPCRLDYARCIDRAVMRVAAPQTVSSATIPHPLFYCAASVRQDVDPSLEELSLTNPPV